MSDYGDGIIEGDGRPVEPEDYGYYWYWFWGSKVTELAKKIKGDRFSHGILYQKAENIPERPQQVKS